MLTSRTRYPGAQPFSDDEISRKTFFGRKRESTDLANKILANRLVVVYAKSGLGKTSLLNAGVAQRLRNEQCLSLMVRVNDVQHGPFMSILEGIRTAAKRQAVEYAPGSQTSLWHFFKTAEFWQGDLLLTPVLILDQFEELFTLQSTEAQAAFLADLGFLVRGVPPATTPQTDVDTTKRGALHSELTETPPALRIVLSLREDCLGFLEEAADWIPQILDHRFRLTPLSIEAAVEALTGPAEVDDNILQTKPFSYAPKAVTTIIDHLSRRSGQLTTYTARHVEPFHLQLICQRIERIVVARQQSTGSALTITMEDIGGEAALRATLEDFYKQEIYALSSRRQRRAVRRLCEEYLISPEGRRLSIEEHEIHRQLKLSGETLEKLVDRRLLRSDQRADSTYYELSHDTLVEPVLATRRVKGRFLGALTICAGALLSLLGVLIGLTKSETDIFEILFGAIIFFSLGSFGIFLFRRGVRTFRRYRSFSTYILHSVPGEYNFLWEIYFWTYLILALPKTTIIVFFLIDEILKIIGVDYSIQNWTYLILALPKTTIIVFFLIDEILKIIGVDYSIQNLPFLGLINFIVPLLSIILLLAVYSYAFKENILHANCWKILLWLVVFFVVESLLEVYVFPKDFVSNILQFLKRHIYFSRWELLVEWLVSLPGIYALYKLSSK
jgi:Novel STAND NTPase 1